MPPKHTPSPQLDKLKTLTGASQVALAIEIVDREKDVRAVRAALDVLKSHPSWDARPALLARYAALAADGVKRDAGTYLRAAILQALRSLVQPDDVPLLEQAAATYEYLPPTHSEEAGLLRSTALVVLNEVDSALAAYHAVRLLNDPETSPLSGEPALTAVRLLAAQDNRLPLYAYVFNNGHGQQSAPLLSEVISECLKSLAGMPVSLVPAVITAYEKSTDEGVLVGLVDLALEYSNVRAATDFIRALLGRTRQYAVYRYLVVRLVIGHDAHYLADLTRLAGTDTDPQRLSILEDTLALGAGDPRIKAALAALNDRRAAEGGRGKGARK